MRVLSEIKDEMGLEIEIRAFTAFHELPFMLRCHKIIKTEVKYSWIYLCVFAHGGWFYE